LSPYCPADGSETGLRVVRGWVGVAVGVVTVLGLGGAPPAAAEIPVPLPDLGLAHRAADGGINLFRAPLSELEEGYGEVELVRNLPARAGWRFDRARVWGMLVV
jgi:hypothetical protein